MKKFFTLFIVFLSLLWLAGNVSAQTWETESLSIVRSLADQPKAVDILFSEPVDINSVRVTVENPVTNAMISVEGYTGSLTTANGVQVTLGESLLPSTTYKLTVNSAISLQWKTINSGVDAIREFVTPAQFMVDNSSIAMNAPANTSAVLVETNANTGATMTGEVASGSLSTTLSGETNKADTPAEAKELPATGAETVIILAIVFFLATMIMFLKRKSA